MNQTTVTKTIAAPIDRVFETIANVENFQRAIPHIVDIEFLSERRQGVGTRFRETRLNGGKPSVTELEMTECVANHRVRMVADSHGSIWDSVFTVREVAEGTELTMTMEAKAHQLAAKLMNTLAMPMIRSHVESDMDLLKQYCEEPREPPPVGC